MSQGHEKSFMKKEGNTITLLKPAQGNKCKKLGLYEKLDKEGWVSGIVVTEGTCLKQEQMWEQRRVNLNFIIESTAHTNCVTNNDIHFCSLFMCHKIFNLH